MHECFLATSDERRVVRFAENMEQYKKASQEPLRIAGTPRWNRDKGDCAESYWRCQSSKVFSKFLQSLARDPGLQIRHAALIQTHRLVKPQSVILNIEELRTLSWSRICITVITSATNSKTSVQVEIGCTAARPVGSATIGKGIGT